MRALPAVKDLYAGSAQGVRRMLVRYGPEIETPPVEHRWRHWAYSLGAVHDSSALVELDVPWWTYRAAAEVHAWLTARPAPVTVFEYGSGASTVWLARRADRVHSVEHHAGFAGQMQQALAEHPHAVVRVVEPVGSPRPVVPSRKEGHAGLDFESYVGAIDEVPGSFDLVVIDGRAREACLEAAVGRLAPDGMIVFDNSRRQRYREAIRRSGLRERVLRGLTPSLPYPEQTSLLRRP
ncbi:class I SAM-dependent methyltransferase [Nocardioides renjunii]|uniref:class I SAM-dependent methyltransferase n=1 Tax=Nocardioides renjunii TaxID=3095075 RepID=UPI002AFE8D33|nr:class I SAM-dependent methyltransferase [Nocardioides sp. S-34]WQQ24142.1 class I SAM-dependent methyltransferase [Nocardioides sp. S-34]